METFCINKNFFFIGEMITATEGEARTLTYANEEKGCFIFFGIKDLRGKNMW